MSCSNTTTVGSRIGIILAAAVTIAGTCGLADAQVVRPPGGTGNPSHGNGPGSGFSGQFGGAGTGRPGFNGGGPRGSEFGGNGFGSGVSNGNAPRPFTSAGQNRFGQGINRNRYLNGGNGGPSGFGYANRGNYNRRGGRFNRGLGIATLGGFGLGYGLGSSGYYDGYDAPYGYGSNFDGIGPGSSFGTTFYGPATGAVYGVDPNQASVAGLPVDNGYAGSPGQSCQTPRKTCELRSEAPVGVGCSCKGEGRVRLRGVVVE